LKGDRRGKKEIEAIGAPTSWSYTNRRMQFLDLVREGNIGPMKAIDQFKYQGG
jgi:DNA-directed RNA polymerase sigma subunit (sigma70/sigma32)